MWDEITKFRMMTRPRKQGDQFDPSAHLYLVGGIVYTEMLYKVILIATNGISVLFLFISN